MKKRKRGRKEENEGLPEAKDIEGEERDQDLIG